MIMRGIVAGLLALTLFPAFSQAPDTAFVTLAQSQAQKIYNQSIGAQSHLFNGSEYKEYHSQRDEHPYLLEEWVYGKILYRGELYQSVPLFFDLELDQVITSYPQGNRVQLLREQVQWFTLENRQFTRLENKQVTPGFYEVAYDGDYKFYIRHQKVRGIKVNGNTADNVFEERIKYYILKNGIFYSVKGKRSVLALVSDQKKVIKQTLRSEHISFGSSRVKAIARILERYEELVKTEK